MQEAPTIVGLTFRYFSGEADHAMLAEIMNRDMAADHYDMTVSADEVAYSFTPSERYDPYRRLVIAEVGGTPVAYATFFSGPLQDGSQLCSMQGAVMPDWRRQGLGRALLHHTEGLARAWASQQVAPNPSFYQGVVSDKAVGTIALFEQEGYLPVRHFYEMVRPHLEEIPEARLPPGVEVRPVQPEHYRQIWEAVQENFAGLWGRPIPSNDAYEKWLANPFFQPSLWRVAWAGDQVVGHVLSFIIADENEARGWLRGYTEIIGVRSGWRRQGLATALLCQSLHAIKAEGMTEATLGVDTDNAHRALQLYEHCGFVAGQRETAYRKPMVVKTNRLPT
jgi:mycothiol synthase